jgi:hypothetical protein
MAETPSQHRIFVLHGEEVRDEKSFFARALIDLPMDPPIESVHYDALVDSLSAGIADVDAGNVAILWTGAQCIFQVNMNDFLRIAVTLHDVVERLFEPDVPVSLTVFLLGKGQEFPTLDELIRSGTIRGWNGLGQGS